MDDDRSCNMKEIGIAQIKMFEGMVRKLKEVRYVPQVKRKFISVGALKALDHAVSVTDGVFKITKGSMVVMKGVQRNNLYYLMGRRLQDEWQLLFFQIVIAHRFGI